MESISTDDLQILQEAMSRQAEANSNKVFVEGYIARKYKLQNGDSVDISTAGITRNGHDDTTIGKTSPSNQPSDDATK